MMAKSKGTESGKSLLKTTTWAGLIALSFLAAAFGFQGSFSSSHGDSTKEIEARLESPEVRSTPVPAHHAEQNAYSQQKSRLSGLTLDLRRTNSVPSLNGLNSKVTSTSPVISNVATKPGAPALPL